MTKILKKNHNFSPKNEIKMFVVVAFGLAAHPNIFFHTGRFFLSLFSDFIILCRFFVFGFRWCCCYSYVQRTIFLLVIAVQTQTKWARLCVPMFHAQVANYKNALRCCHVFVYGTLCFTVDGVSVSLITHVFLVCRWFFSFLLLPLIIIIIIIVVFVAGCLIFFRLFICTVWLLCTLEINSLPHFSYVHNITFIDRLENALIDAFLPFCLQCGTFISLFTYSFILVRSFFSLVLVGACVVALIHANLMKWSFQQQPARTRKKNDTLQLKKNLCKFFLLSSLRLHTIVIYCSRKLRVSRPKNWNNQPI